MEPVTVGDFPITIAPNGRIVALGSVFLAVEDEGFGKTLFFQIMQGAIHCRLVAELTNAL